MLTNSLRRPSATRRHYKKGRNKEARERYQRLLPTLQLVEGGLKGNQIKRDIKMFRLYCTGLYSFSEIGEMWGGLTASRVGQIVHDVAHQIENPHKPVARQDRTIYNRNRKLFSDWCSGEYTYRDLATKYNLGEPRISQIIRDAKKAQELRQSKESIDEDLINVV